MHMRGTMKNIIVTGAGGGMGSAICRLLVKRGYQVFGLDCREWNQTDDGEEYEGQSSLHFVFCDVTSEVSVSAAFEQIKARAGHLDGIVHTAGIYDLDSLLEMSEERFMRIFNINLFGVYRINKIFLPLLSRGSRILITTSELAPLDPLPFTGVYAITKAALEKYAYSLRMEVNLLGISVSVIRPGAVKTGLLNDSTCALDRFVGHTKIYRCNAPRFKHIVDSVEAKNIAPDVIANAVLSALTARHPKFVYNRNRNILLRLLNLLPDVLQVWIIKKILTPP